METITRLRDGDRVPFFAVHTLDGRAVRYTDLWQRRSLLLIALADPDSMPARAYLDELARHGRALTLYATDLVITREPVQGLPAPGVLVADRFGEIFQVFDGSQGLPPVPELVESLRFMQRQCPECSHL
jgi:hypothetical protein